MDVLFAQLEQHQDLPKTVDELHGFLNPKASDRIDHDGRFAWAAGEAIMTFGQHTGRSLRDLVESEPDYLGWMLGRDFPADVKDIVRAALRGDFPSRSDAH